LQKIPENIIVLQNKNLLLTNVSSTAIRERVQKNLSLEYLVPKTIEEYIREKELYK
jgi:nicotinic acid mononucleotide adenylyltransferase